MSYLIRFHSDWFRVKEFFKDFWLYWRRPHFAKEHLKFLVAYLGQNPFRISRTFLEKRGEKDLYAYGETPLTVLEEICDAFDVKAKERVYEIGCGRGLTCLWLRHVRGCKVTGVDFVPAFIAKAKSFEDADLKYVLEDYTRLSYENADVVYLYSYSDTEPLAESLLTLRKGAKVITVSFPISDLDPKNFDLVSHIPVLMPWGEASVYLSLKKTASSKESALPQQP